MYIKKPGMLLTYYDDPNATPLDEEGNDFILLSLIIA